MAWYLVKHSDNFYVAGSVPVLHKNTKTISHAEN